MIPLLHAIPVDHPIGKVAGNAKIGVVFHTHYTGDELESMQAKAGADVTGSKDALVIKNDTPMDRVGWSSSEEKIFDTHVSKIESMCKVCGYFLDELVKFSGTKGDLKWHVSSYIKQFFNSEIRNARSIGNVDHALDNLCLWFWLRRVGCYKRWLC